MLYVPVDPPLMIFTGSPDFLRQIAALAHARQHLHRTLSPALESLGVRRAAGVCHEALKLHVFGRRHFLRQFQRRLPAVDALPRHTRKHRHRDPQPWHCAPPPPLPPSPPPAAIVGHEHEGRIFLREQHGSLDVVDARRLLGPQHTFDARVREQFRLGDRGDVRPMAPCAI